MASIDHRHIGRGAGHGALDHRAGQAPAADPVQADHPRVGGGHRLDHRGGAVGGIVVDEDRLPDHAVQRRLQLGQQRQDVGRFLEGRDDHAELQRAAFRVSQNGSPWRGAHPPS
jgi:hypothetical protein